MTVASADVRKRARTYIHTRLVLRCWVYWIFLVLKFLNRIPLNNCASITATNDCSNNLMSRPLKKRPSCTPAKAFPLKTSHLRTTGNYYKLRIATTTNCYHYELLPLRFATTTICYHYELLPQTTTTTNCELPPPLTTTTYQPQTPKSRDSINRGQKNGNVAHVGRRGKSAKRE